MVVFDSGSPVNWSKQSSSSGRIKGTIEREAIGIYKYSVTDIAGTITIDPRIRVKR
jgi:pyrrolidone-carboxylate peptidase